MLEAIPKESDILTDTSSTLNNSNEGEVRCNPEITTSRIDEYCNLVSNIRGGFEGVWWTEVSADCLGGINYENNPLL